MKILFDFLFHRRVSRSRWGILPGYDYERPTDARMRRQGSFQVTPSRNRRGNQVESSRVSVATPDDDNR